MSSETAASTMNQDSTTALVPKLRFPEFRGAEKWKLKAGNSLFAQIKDRNPEPCLPVLAITQEHGAIPRYMINYHVSVTEKSIENYKVVQVGDFIISLRSFQGGIEYSHYHGICSPAYVILRRRVNGSDEFFRHYLKTDGFIRVLTKNLEGLRDGKMISYAQFSELLLPIPSHDEQKRIADCLSSLDELIAAQAQKVEVLKTHKKGLMQQLFPREGESQPRLRFPEFQEAGEWVSDSLESLTSTKISYGIVQAGPHISDGMPYIKSTDLNSKLCLANLARTSDAIARKYRRSEVLPGDIVFSLRGNIGIAQIVPESIAVANLTQGTARIRTKGSPEFYLYALYNPSVRNSILAVAKGSTFQEISLQALRTIRLSHPELAEQQRVASCLISLDALITAESQKLEALKTHKKGLMQQLFPSAEESQP
ncbi:MAG: restriction endonuclease subunit S [Cyanobacteriota bacterium]